MKTGFLNSTDDVQWLKETHLNGVFLPAKYQRFASFVLQGNEDCPHAINLYVSNDPLYSDDFYRIRFVNESGAYAEACEYCGQNNRPYGGLAPLV